MLEKGVTATDLGIIGFLSTVLSLTTGIFISKTADAYGRVNERANHHIIAISVLFSLIIFSSTLFADQFTLPPAIVYGTLYVLDSVSMSAIHSLSFSVVMQSLRGVKEKHPGERMFASVSWGFACLFVGYCIDVYTYKAVYYLNFLFCMLTLYSLYGMESAVGGSNFEQKDKPKKNEDGNEDLWDLYTLENSCFLVLLVSLSVSKKVLSTYGRNVFATKQVNSSNTEIGMMILSSTLFEVPTMFFGDHLLNICGGNLMMIIAATVSILRTLCLLYVNNISVDNNIMGLHIFGVGPLIWIELLHGVAFSFKDIADKSIQVTMFNSSAYLASLRGFIIGIADSFGILGAGFLYDNYGPGMLFKSLFGLSLFCLAIFCASVFRFKPTAADRTHIV